MKWGPGGIIFTPLKLGPTEKTWKNKQKKYIDIGEAGVRVLWRRWEREKPECRCRWEWTGGRWGGAGWLPFSLILVLSLRPFSPMKPLLLLLLLLLPHAARFDFCPITGRTNKKRKEGSRIRRLDPDKRVQRAHLILEVQTRDLNDP